MKTFNEWLFLEYGGVDPQYHNIEVLGWSLSTGVLPPWDVSGDDGINPRSSFAGRASGPESTRVYKATENIRKRKDAEEVLEYLYKNVSSLRRVARYAESGDPQSIQILRDFQYSLMTGKTLQYGEDPPKDFVAPDPKGKPGNTVVQPVAQQANAREAGFFSNLFGRTAQPKQTSAQQPQPESKVVTCPHCKRQFNT